MIVIPNGSVWEDTDADRQFTIIGIDETPGPSADNDSVVVEYEDGTRATHFRDHFRGSSFTLVDDGRPSCPRCGQSHPEAHVEDENRCTRCRHRLTPENVV
jgi:ribosomal protein S27AE